MYDVFLDCCGIPCHRHGVSSTVQGQCTTIIIINSFSIALFNDQKDAYKIKHEEGDDNQGGDAADSTTEDRSKVECDCR